MRAWLNWKIALGVVISGYLGVMIWAAASSGGGKEPAYFNNPLGNPPGMVDRLVVIDAAEGFGQGELKKVVAARGGAGLELAPGETRDYPRTGTWTTAQTPGDFPFTELIPSLNASISEGTGVRLDVRVRNAATAQWSPWLYFGSFGRAPIDTRLTAFHDGEVHVDNLVLRKSADAWQARLRLYSFVPDATTTPRLRRLTLSYSGVVEDANRRNRLAPPPAVPDGWARNLEVPFFTQQDAPTSLRPQICSPTSTTMVMSFCGVERQVVENALAIYDSENDMFGNWARAVARAGELGLDAWLTRFRTWDQVKIQIASGQPIVASIAFKKGEFPSSVLKSTDGHLIVIRGFTPQGDVIVNDPANRERGNGVVYKAAELGHAWFGHGGVGYIIRRPAPASAQNESQSQGTP